MLVQRDSFLVAQSTAQLNIAFTRKLGAGFFGGEGFILQKLDREDWHGPLVVNACKLLGITSAIAGRNPIMARWQGLRLERVGLIAFLLSGALARDALKMCYLEAKSIASGKPDLLGSAATEASFRAMISFASTAGEPFLRKLTLPSAVTTTVSDSNDAAGMWFSHTRTRLLSITGFGLTA